MDEYIINEIIEIECDDDGYIKVKFKIEDDDSESFREIESDEYFYWAEENFDENDFDLDSPVDDEWDDNVVYSNTLFNFPKWKDQHHEEETVINFIYTTFPLKEDLPLLVYEKINSSS
jgi:hypothetical protein